MLDDAERAIGCPAVDVGPSRVELLLLQVRVEDAEVRGRVETCAGNPLPGAGVRGEVAVGEMAAKPLLAAAPVDMEILDEEARGDHAGTIGD